MQVIWSIGVTFDVTYLVKTNQRGLKEGKFVQRNEYKMN